MNQVECIKSGICFWCEEDISGKLTDSNLQTFNKTGLCPECWIQSIKTDLRKNEKAPIQLGLPIIGSMPALIHIGPVSFGTLCSTRSELLKDCIIRSVFHGSICAFDIICNDEVTRNKIRDYVIGESQRANSNN